MKMLGRVFIILALVALVLVPATSCVELQGQRYSVGNGPEGICFDDQNIWVTNYFDDEVTKLRASDGSLVGTYSMHMWSWGICFDGQNIWVTNFDDDEVTKLRASDNN